MFLHLSVILFTGRGCLPLVLGGVCHTLPSRHPLDRHPQADTPLGRHAPGETPPGHTTPPGRHLLPSACWDTPPPPVQCMLGYGQQAGGTHPTEMHTCYTFNNKTRNLHMSNIIGIFISSQI